MKFVVDKEELNRLLSNVQSVTAQKPSVPILANVLLVASEDGILEMTATDLTVGTRCRLPVKVFESGATTVPAKKLSSLIRELTSATIEFTTNSEDVSEIVANTSRFKLHGMNREEYPTLPDLEDSRHFTINQSTLKDMFYRTSFAVSREDNRYVLTGVLMRIEEDKVTFVGTDGKRLAKAFTSLTLNPEIIGEYVIPLKAVDEIQKILYDKEDSEATIYIMDDKLAITAEGTTIVTKLLSGEYPDFKRVIPDDPAVMLTIHRAEMMSLLRQVSLFISENDHAVRFSFGDGEVTVLANSMQIGEGTVSMPVNYTGERIDIAFNPNYFLDILKHSKDETVTLGVTDSFNPGLVTDSSGVLFVLMPMRMNEE